jgi:hypothetical protein
MIWEVNATDTYAEWLAEQSDEDRENILVSIELLKVKGPMLGRPHADTVSDSKHSNMKELRTQSDGDPIRSFFAFDPDRRAILLCGGDKTGKKKFYEKMIHAADKEYDEHLKTLKGATDDKRTSTSGKRKPRS